MTGRPGDRTMQINLKEDRVIHRKHPLHPCVLLGFIGLEAKGLLDFRKRAEHGFGEHGFKHRAQ